MAQPMRVLQHEQLPPEAEQLAAAHQLGTPQAKYKVRTIIWAILGGFLFLIPGGFFVLGALLNLTDAGTFIILFLLGLFLLGMGLYVLIPAIIHRSLRVYVCAGGFISVEGSKAEPFPWDQIEAMWQQVTRRYTNGIYTGTTYKYTIRRKDGRQIILNNRFAKVEELGNTLSREITNYMLPLAISTYNAGGTLTFGSLSINKQGVSNGKELLPWNQIKEMGMRRGIVTVRKEGKWLSWSSVRVAKVPNVFVFMALVNNILRSQK